MTTDVTFVSRMLVLSKLFQKLLRSTQSMHRVVMMMMMMMMMVTTTMTMALMVE